MVTYGYGFRYIFCKSSNQSKRIIAHVSWKKVFKRQSPGPDQTNKGRGTFVWSSVGSQLENIICYELSTVRSPDPEWSCVRALKNIKDLKFPSLCHCLF